MSEQSTFHLEKRINFSQFRFLRRNKDNTIKEIAMASEKLQESCKDMEKNQKLFADKANEKYKVLKEGMEKLMKRD